MKSIQIVFLVFISSIFTQALTQVSEEDAFYIKAIHDEVLERGECYDWLTHLSENIGARLSGSDNYNRAADYTQQELQNLLIEKIWRQSSEVDYWERGTHASVVITDSYGKQHKLRCLALGRSVGTPQSGISAEVIEVKSLDEVENLGRNEIEDKIVFL